MIRRSLVVVGAGGLGLETIALANSIRAVCSDSLALLGVLAADIPDADFDRLGIRYLGRPTDLAVLNQLPDRCSFVVAIGDGQVRERVRKALVAEGLSETALIHPSAVISDDVEIRGGIIAAGCVISTAVQIGQSCVIDIGSTISHDSVLGDSVTLAPGVHVTGGVTIEDRATVFAGSTITPRLRIGQDATVGAGAVVLSDVAAGSTVVGSPALPIRRG